MLEDMLHLKHDTEKISDSFNITEKRMLTLRDKFEDLRDTLQVTSKVIEHIWNEDNLTFEEKVLMTYQAGRFL